MATSKTQAGKAQADKAQTSQPQKIAVRNVNHPGAITRLDAGMYDAMKRALLKVLPKTSPGLTVDEVHGGVMPHLPQDLFPGGAKSGWWLKAVQLDLEARGVIARENTKPLRLHKA